MNNKVGDFCKRIKSQQSDLTIKIPVFHKIQFSKKDSCNKTMKNEANQWQLFSESQILQQNRPPKKVHTYGSLDFIFSTAPATQNSPRLEIHIRNVSQDTFFL